jgi:hypothetical protein
VRLGQYVISQRVEKLLTARARFEGGVGIEGVELEDVSVLAVATTC